MPPKNFLIFQILNFAGNLKFLEKHFRERDFERSLDSFGTTGPAYNASENFLPFPNCSHHLTEIEDVNYYENCWTRSNFD